MDQTRVEDGGEGLETSDPAAASLGLIALGLACVPLALLLVGWDDGPRGAWAFADAQKWPSLRAFCLASTIGLAPVLLLARRALDIARRAWAKVPAASAIVLALPMVPGAVIQLTWWISG